MAETENIDTEKKIVKTTIGDLSYDFLVIATGATSNFFGMKNIERHSMSMKNLTDALDLRSLIIQNFENALNTNDLKERESLMNFVIVGAGPTGIELAGALAELKSHVLPKDYPDLDIRRMQIHVVEANSRVLGAMSETASEKSEKYLKQRDIYLWLNTLVKDFDGNTIFTNNKNFSSKTLIWAAGIKADFPGGIHADISKDNRLITDEYNAVTDCENVYAIGDVSKIKSENTPEGHAMLASVAAQQGYHLAKNFNRMARKKEPIPFVYKDKGTMATIGRNKAVVDLSFIKFGGFWGWFTWMFVHLMLLVDFRSRVLVFINWVWSYINYDKSTRLIVRKYLGTENQ
jgi:NADH dehydrogenase